MSDFFATTLVDYLGVQCAKLFNLKRQPIVAQLTFRMNPTESAAPTNIAMTPEQLLRLRNDINTLLHDPATWLYNAEDAAIGGRLSPEDVVPEGFVEPDHVTDFESPADAVLKEQ